MFAYLYNLFEIISKRIYSCNFEVISASTMAEEAYRERVAS